MKATQVPMASAKPLPQPLDNMSPAGAFVSVFTPTDASAVPSTEEVDINGIKIGGWASDLKACDLKSPYFWTVCCCPCIPVAQLEVRLGWSSYGGALFRQVFSYSVLWSFVIANLHTIVRILGGEPALCAQVVLLAGLLLTAVLIARRVGKMRTEVRERFHIDGTVKDDQYVALMHTRRTIRQLGKHLQCDRAYFRGAPTTLQAYQV